MNGLEDITAVSSLDTLVNSSEKPFQVLVKTIHGTTIVINDLVSSSKILNIMKAIQDKDGFPVETQRLVFGKKELNPNKTLADYKIKKEDTLTSLLRIKGGLGEYKAMEYIDKKKMNRGNVKKEIQDTVGESRALKDWGRNLEEDNSFWEEIKKDLNMNSNDFKNWRLANKTHVAALIKETTHSGNCGDFAEVVHSKLSRSTSKQYVYMLAMENPLPDNKQDPNSEWITNTDDNEKKAWFLANRDKRKIINRERLKANKKALNPKKYDHQLCVTYHKSVNELSEMDQDQAMIADGWDGNMVCTLKQFLKGANAYRVPLVKERFGLKYPNISLFNRVKAKENSGPTNEEVLAITKIITGKLDDYKQNGSYQQDKTNAKDNFSGVFNMDPRNGVTDKRTDETIKVFLNKIDLENDLSKFKAEFLDLKDNQIAVYCKNLTDTKVKQAIIGDQDLKAKLIEIFKIDLDILELFYTEFPDEEFVMMIITHAEIAKRAISKDSMAGDLAKIIGRINNSQKMFDLITALKATSFIDDFIDEDIEDAGGKDIWVNIIRLLRQRNATDLANYVLSKIPNSNKTEVEQALNE